jgi:hypothetical protein
MEDTCSLMKETLRRYKHRPLPTLSVAPLRGPDV